MTPAMMESRLALLLSSLCGSPVDACAWLIDTVCTLSRVCMNFACRKWGSELSTWIGKLKVPCKEKVDVLLIILPSFSRCLVGVPGQLPRSSSVMHGAPDVEFGRTPIIE